MASGGAERHGPKFWLKNKQTCELRDEFPNGGIPPITATKGRYGGTYAVKELVYAYAMWVSPKFHLAVIRAYDQMVTSGRPDAAPSHDLSTMPRSQMLDHFQLLLTHARDAEAKRVELEGKLAVVAPKADALDRLSRIKDARTTGKS